MDVLIETTRNFEADLEVLGDSDVTLVAKMIDDCAMLFSTQKDQFYSKLRHLSPLSNLNGYASSLYILRISPKLKVILTVDEDPIFKQAIFTLFRVVIPDVLDQAYQDIAKSLYEKVLHSHREIAQVS